MRGSDLRTGDVFLCRPRTEGACEPSAAADPLHHQPGPRRPRWRVWKAVCGRRATLDRPRAAAAGTFVAGALQHPFGAPVDGTGTLQSALSLVCRCWSGGSSLGAEGVHEEPRPAARGRRMVLNSDAIRSRIKGLSYSDFAFIRAASPRRAHRSSSLSSRTQASAMPMSSSRIKISVPSENDSPSTPMLVDTMAFP